MAGWTSPSWKEGHVAAAAMNASGDIIENWAAQSDQGSIPWWAGNNSDIVLPAYIHYGIDGTTRQSGGFACVMRFPVMTADMLAYVVANQLNDTDAYTGTTKQWSRYHNDTIYVQYQLVRLPRADEWAGLATVAGGWQDFPIYFIAGNVIQVGV